MAKGINPARMRMRLTFGKIESSGDINPNTGEAMDSFTPKFTKWAGKWTISQTQALTLAGTLLFSSFVMMNELQVISLFSGETKRIRLTVFLMMMV